MSDAFTAPVLVAAGLLCLSGLAKLRSPEPAAAALRVAGIPLPVWVVRTFSAAELALGLATLVAGNELAALALAALYLAFAGLALLLARRRAACGCFGVADAPVTAWHGALSVLLAAACLGAAAGGWHSVTWVVDRPPAEAAVLLIGLGACVYAAMIAYTALPAAWTAWGGR